MNVSTCQKRDTSFQHCFLWLLILDFGVLLSVVSAGYAEDDSSFDADFLLEDEEFPTLHESVWFETLIKSCVMSGNTSLV